MTDTDKNSCAHTNTTRVNPVLIVKGADKAIEHYKKAFGAVEAYPPMLDPKTGAVLHASLKIGETELFLTEENRERGCIASQGQSFYMYVPDADEAMKKAIQAGMTETRKAEDMFWGDRMGMVTDPYGLKWNLATHVRDVSPQELEEAARKMGSKAA